MKRKRYTEPQIVFALRQADSGTAVAEICRKMGIAEATFYRWEKHYGGIGLIVGVLWLRCIHRASAALRMPLAGIADNTAKGG